MVADNLAGPLPAGWCQIKCIFLIIDGHELVARKCVHLQGGFLDRLAPALGELSHVELIASKNPLLENLVDCLQRILALNPGRHRSSSPQARKHPVPWSKQECQ